MKNRYLYFQQLAWTGVILVRPEEFIRDNHNNKVDFAILDNLYLLRNYGPQSARELTSALQRHCSCDNGHVFTRSTRSKPECPDCHREARLLLPEKNSAERTVRNHLDKLKLDGAIKKTTRTPTGKSGRAPEVYYLSDDFMAKLELYLNMKKMKLGCLVDAYIAPNWLGIWETNFGELEIAEGPSGYIGKYPNGTIEGNTEADTFIGTWHEGANSGDFEFTMFEGGQSFWGDRYDGAHRRLRGWSGKMVGHEKCSHK